MCKNTRSIFCMVFAALSVMGLSSCLMSHQYAWEHAHAYAGIAIDSPKTCIEHKGKLYVSGYRAEFRRYMDEPFADIKGNTYHWSEIPGTRGEELYHEVEIGCGIEGKGESLVVVPNSQVNLKRGGQWQALEFQHANTRHFKYGCTPQDIVRSSRHLSIHALYALPAVPLLFAADVAATTAMATVGGAVLLVITPFNASQQQTPIPEVPQPTTN